MDNTNSDHEIAAQLRSIKLKKRGVVAAVVGITLLIHLIGALVAGAIMIVHDIIEDAEDFEEPPVIAAPQKQPEYQVNIAKLKRQSSPPRPRAIVVHNPNNIALPALVVPKINENIAITGRGSGGFGVGVGGGSAPPRVNIKVTNFGYEEKVTGALEGHFIDLKQTNEMQDSNIDMKDALKKFMRGDWTIDSLKQFYIAKQKLYATFFCIPSMDAKEAPKVYNVDKEVEPAGWRSLMYRNSGSIS